MTNRIGTTLIQTRVTTKVNHWVKQQAKKAGLSTAAWLRNHLVVLQQNAEESKKHTADLDEESE